MNLQPKEVLTEQEVEKGLRRVVWDGLFSEAMTTLTGGAFIIAMAILLDANNLQLGLIAALPTMVNMFQLISIWLVRQFNNRRGLPLSAPCWRVYRSCSLAWCRFYFPVSLPLNYLYPYFSFIISLAPLPAPAGIPWMKDLIPDNRLGAFFGRRSAFYAIAQRGAEPPDSIGA